MYSDSVKEPQGDSSHTLLWSGKANFQKKSTEPQTKHRAVLKWTLRSRTLLLIQMKLYAIFHTVVCALLFNLRKRRLDRFSWAEAHFN